MLGRTCDGQSVGPWGSFSEGGMRRATHAFNSLSLSLAPLRLALGWGGHLQHQCLALNQGTGSERQAPSVVFLLGGSTPWGDVTRNPKSSV